MLILGLNKTTLLDYPGYVAATVFTGGCNFRCPFCHNKALVLEPFKGGIISEKDFFAFLKKRKNILKGVCITGGEPTLQADLPDFLARIQEIGYRIKLDTNGYKPEIIRGLIEKGLLDYVAMDIKNSPEKYAISSGMGNMGHDLDLGKIKESVDLLMEGRVEYEFRTTVVRELHMLEDMVKIGEWIRGCRAYFLQKFQNQGNNICEGYHTPDEGTLREMHHILSQMTRMEGRVYLRGIDLL